MFWREKPRFYAETTEPENSLKVFIHDRKNQNKVIGDIDVEVVPPKFVWVAIHAPSKESNHTFARTFKRTVGQELLIRAAKWGLGKGLTHFYLKDLSNSAGRTFQGFVEFGILSKEGKILPLPRQLNLKRNRLLEKPLTPRKSLLRRKSRKRTFRR